MNSVQEEKIRILPYSRVVGQEQLKLALELAYIAPRLGGVLISGQRGTAKSTTVRAFAQMIYGRLPVTLPINATEDRVVGGWDINQLMLGETIRQPGLLEEAAGLLDLGKNKDKTINVGGLLYIDEINLLDDHIVNIILDVTSTGILEVQREAQKITPKKLSFTLVGTMNPEEGGLRPQLLDRFGLMVSVQMEAERKNRIKILETVLEFDEVLSNGSLDYFDNAEVENTQQREYLDQARQRLYEIKIPDDVIESCIDLTEHFNAQGNRGDYIMAMAARAYAALQSAREKPNLRKVTKQHVAAVAKMVLQHRRPEALQSSQMSWIPKDDEEVKTKLKL